MVRDLARWLRDEEAAGSNPATPTQVKGHSHSRKWPFLCRQGSGPGRSADGSGAFDEIPGVMLVDRPLVVGHLGLLDLIDPAKLFGHDVH